MDTHIVIRNLEKTRHELERHVVSDDLISAWEKACQEFNYQMEGIRLFAGKMEIGLDEDWTHAHPIGFIFHEKLCFWHSSGDAIKIYIGLAKKLKERDETLFKNLPDFKEFTSKRGNIYITRDPFQLRKAKQLAKNVFFETNLNNQLIRNNIVELLRIYEIDHSNVHFYLQR
ncbi:MAG TPA: hypothetical protein VFB72_11720 [Verrucomicrobiae bacterium]|nr:hypothetical protein [Verrucomicrobiae bacterium]